MLLFFVYAEDDFPEVSEEEEESLYQSLQIHFDAAVIRLKDYRERQTRVALESANSNNTQVVLFSAAAQMQRSATPPPVQSPLKQSDVIRQGHGG